MKKARTKVVPMPSSRSLFGQVQVGKAVSDTRCHLDVNSFFIVLNAVCLMPVDAMAHSASRVAALPVVIAVFGVLGLVCLSLSTFSLFLWRRSRRGSSSPWLKRIAILDCIVALQIFGVWLLVGARFSGSHAVLFCAALAMTVIGIGCIQEAKRTSAPL